MRTYLSHCLCLRLRGTAYFTMLAGSICRAEGPRNFRSGKHRGRDERQLQEREGHMPFSKPNWHCEPPLKQGGFFEYGKVQKLCGLKLTKGEQTRPCFVHVSSEVECLVRSMSMVVSVEVVDVYVLIGPADALDYVHVGRLRGESVGPAQGDDQRFSFRLDPSQMPREPIWQLQLKLSSGSQGVSVVIVDELSVCVERVTIDGLHDVSRFGAATAQVGSKPASQDRHLSSAGSERLASTMGASRSGGNGRAVDTSRYFTPSNTMDMSTSGSAAPLPAPPRATPLSRFTQPPLPEAPGQGMAESRSSGGDMSLRLRGEKAATTARRMPQQGPQQLAMKEETAAVASVLNAVCEKMVGVVSEKTKSYLNKAGKRTERRVVDRIMRLEERIEKFDQTLEHAGVTRRIGSVEQGLVGLQQKVASSV